jgi:hypothetical protein
MRVSEKMVLWRLPARKNVAERVEKKLPKQKLH